MQKDSYSPDSDARPYDLQEAYSGSFKLQQATRCCLKKRPSVKVARKPSKGTRSKGRWVCAAVELGKKGASKKSHKDGTERIAMVQLPCKADAPRGARHGSMTLF